MTAPRVIVTRPAPDGEIFARAVAAAGMTPISSPVMEIVFRRGPVDLSDVRALAFTSANGVRAYAALCQKRGLTVLAIGEITAAAARAAGFTTIEAAAGDVDSLAALAAQRAIDGAVLHVSGSDHAGDLVGLLARKGVAARRAVLYEARPVAALSPAALSALAAPGPADWAALFSPRSARLFIAQASAASLGESLSAVRAGCLSAAVAEAASAAQFRSIDIAPGRSAAAMIALISGTSR